MERAHIHNGTSTHTQWNDLRVSCKYILFMFFLGGNIVVSSHGNAITIMFDFQRSQKMQDVRPVAQPRVKYILYTNS